MERAQILLYNSILHALSTLDKCLTTIKQNNNKRKYKPRTRSKKTGSLNKNHSN